MAHLQVVVTSMIGGHDDTVVQGTFIYRTKKPLSIRYSKNKFMGYYITCNDDTVVKVTSPKLLFIYL